ncbi:MAG TPA: PA2169 family four-helix-bundle protein [Saprospiraceae bacterium]|nr:PA2169 family four-helix-bundle protein [Saprospiraceae bacterium]
MNSAKSIEVLNELIELNNDRIEGYRTALKETDEPRLISLFSQFMETSKTCKQELISELQKFGGKPIEGTSTAGKVFRVWMDIKAALTGKIYKEILASCEYGEDVAVSTYYNLLLDHRDGITSVQEAMLNKQYLLLKAEHDKVKGLRDAL